MSEGVGVVSVINLLAMLAGLIVVVIIVVFVIMSFAKNSKQAAADNKADKQKAEAVLVEKREIRAKFGMIYYAKFNLKSGEAYEFRVSEGQYARLVQGGEGLLVYQGTRFVSFVKNNV